MIFNSTLFLDPAEEWMHGFLNADVHEIVSYKSLFVGICELALWLGQCILQKI